MEQAVHRLVSMRGLGHWSLGAFWLRRPGSGPSMAPLGHTRPHTPHWVQRMGSMVCTCFTAPVMAPTGQFLAHRVQPMQSCVIWYGIQSPPSL